MPNESKVYQNKISYKTFIEAITISSEEFLNREEQYSKIGIKRVGYEELKEEFGSIIVLPTKDKEWTVFSNSEILVGNDEGEFDPDQFVTNTVFNDCEVGIVINKLKLRTFDNTNCKFYFISSNVRKIKLSGGARIEGIYFEKSNVVSIKLYSDSSISSIRVQDSNVGSILISESKCSNFSIRKKSNIDSLYFYSCNVRHLKIFDKSQIRGFTSSSSKIESIYLNDSISSGKIKIHNKSEIGVVTICRQSRTGEVNVTQYSKIGSLTISDESQTGDLLFQNSEIEEFEADSLVASLIVEKSFVHNIRLDNCYILDLRFKDQSRTVAFVRNSVINLIDLRQTVVDTNTTLSFNSTKIYSCLMDEMLVQGSLHFRNVSAMKEPFKLPEVTIKETKDKYDNYLEELQKNYSIYGSIFRVAYSSLGSTEFIDSNLASFETFEFSHSQISNLFVSGLKAPDQNLKIRNVKEGEIEWFEQVVSFYNQFAKVFEQQGFVYTAANYRSKSSEFQHKLIGKRTKSIEKYVEIIPFVFRRISSNYGTSWLKSLGFIIWTSLALYILYLISVGKIFQLDQSIDYQYVGFYFEFINPFRPYELLNSLEVEMNSFTKLIDLISRIVIGYGIFELISSFRRYGKKNS